MFFKNIREAMEIGKICMSKNTLFIIYLLIIHFDVHTTYIWYQMLYKYQMQKSKMCAKVFSSRIFYKKRTFYITYMH